MLYHDHIRASAGTEGYQCNRKTQTMFTDCRVRARQIQSCSKYSKIFPTLVCFVAH